MKSRHCFFLLCCTATLFFFSSCGENDGNKTATDTNVDSSTTTTASTSSGSTIITTPQTVLAVTHRVSNFAKWKASYDAHDSMRVAAGIHNYVIGRGVEDSNMILVATKVDDIDKAKAFMKDPSLKAAMQKGGVTGNPSMSLTTEVYQDTANLSPDIIRSRTTFTVKDWDAWKKAFESYRQTRLDNGLTDRVYGYDVDDNHKVSLVVAVNDTAKARAFWTSDLLKQQRAESGVTSQPQRFLFRVVQRY